MKRNTEAVKALAMVAVMITAAVVVPLAATPVSAQSDDDSVVDTLFSDEDGESGTWETIYNAAKGLANRYNPLADQPAEATADQYASRTTDTFNGNSSVLKNWTNERVTADTDHDVIRVQFTDESGNTAWMFVVADVNTTTGNYTSVTAMNLTEFKETGREVDLSYRLTPYASRNANQELSTFITEYAEPGENVSQPYLARLAGEYKGEVSGDDLPGGDS